MIPSRVERRPFFLEGTAGRLFGIHFTPQRDRETGRLLLIVPPFAEEMNKSRRMMVLAAEAYSAHGSAALLADLHGTGDSEGDFRDASVSQWCADIECMAHWIAEQRCREVDVLCVRAGALLFPAEQVAAILRLRRLALWQPVLKGKQVVGQFLRLQAAGAMVGKSQSNDENPRAVLQRKGFVEIAGYDLGKQLVEELETLSISDSLAAGWQRARWFEVVAQSGAEVSPAAARTLSAARAQGLSIDALTVAGEPFWATPEIAEVPALIASTSDFLG